MSTRARGRTNIPANFRTPTPPYTLPRPAGRPAAGRTSARRRTFEDKKGEVTRRGFPETPGLSPTASRARHVCVSIRLPPPEGLQEQNPWIPAALRVAGPSFPSAAAPPLAAPRCAERPGCDARPSVPALDVALAAGPSLALFRRNGARDRQPSRAQFLGDTPRIRYRACRRCGAQPRPARADDRSHVESGAGTSGHGTRNTDKVRTFSFLGP